MVNCVFIVLQVFLMKLELEELEDFPSDLCSISAVIPQAPRGYICEGFFFFFFSRIVGSVLSFTSTRQQ